jgi:hypothetical protein
MEMEEETRDDKVAAVAILGDRVVVAVVVVVEILGDKVVVVVVEIHVDKVVVVAAVFVNGKRVGDTNRYKYKYKKSYCGQGWSVFVFDWGGWVGRTRKERVGMFPV